jgi:hypothetical protein
LIECTSILGSSYGEVNRFCTCKTLITYPECDKNHVKHRENLVKNRKPKKQPVTEKTIKRALHPKGENLVKKRRGLTQALWAKKGKLGVLSYCHKVSRRGNQYKEGV